MPALRVLLVAKAGELGVGVEVGEHMKGLEGRLTLAHSHRGT